MKKLAPLFLIIVSVVIFFTVIDPQRIKYNEVNKEKKDRQETFANLNILISERKQLSDKYNAIDNVSREKLSKVLPDTIDNIRLFIDINKIAARYGILIKNLEIGGEKNSSSSSAGSKTSIVSQNTPEAFNRLNVSFVFSASYPNFINFLRDLEESLRVIDIRGLTVDVGQGNNYNFSIQFETYWLK